MSTIFQKLIKIYIIYYTIRFSKLHLFEIGVGLNEHLQVDFYDRSFGETAVDVGGTKIYSVVIKENGQILRIIIDDFVKSRESLENVIPAKAGIQ